MPSDLTRMSISTSPRSNVYPLLQGAVYAEDVNLTKPSVPLAFKKQTQTPFILAWVFCLIFYFAQYAMRSAPSVMLPELTQAFSLSAVGLSTLIGLYYYTYSASRCLHLVRFYLDWAFLCLPSLGVFYKAQEGRLHLLAPSILPPTDFLGNTLQPRSVLPNAWGC